MIKWLYRLATLESKVKELERRIKAIEESRLDDGK